MPFTRLTQSRPTEPIDQHRKVGVVEFNRFLTELENGPLTPTDQTVTGDLTVNGTGTFSDTTDTTSKDTGAVIIEGGVGIEKSVTIGDDLNFGVGSNHTITVNPSVTAATAGDSLTVSAGDGNTSGAGGNVFITGGTGGATGAGGYVNIATGSGGLTSGNSGDAVFATAGTVGTALSGQMTINTGDTVSANSGAITVTTGEVGTAGNSGSHTISTGASTSGNTGALNFKTGDADSGLAGNIVLTPGSFTSATVASHNLINKGLVRKPSSAGIASGGTITGPQLVGGLVAATGATGNWQLPTAAQITTALGTTPAGTSFEFIFNASAMTATNTATLVVGTNMTVMSAPAITGGGSLTVTQNTQVVGVFRIIFDTTTTCKISRIA